MFEWLSRPHYYYHPDAPECLEGQVVYFCPAIPGLEVVRPWEFVKGEWKQCPYYEVWHAASYRPISNRLTSYTSSRKKAMALAEHYGQGEIDWTRAAISLTGDPTVKAFVDRVNSECLDTHFWQEETIDETA